MTGDVNMDCKEDVMPDKPRKCWEYNKCAQTECPVYKQDAGEICFSVRDTLCGGEVQGCCFTKFMGTCSACGFYKLIKNTH